MNLKDALQIYEYARQYGINEDTLITFAGFNKNEYDNLLKDYFSKKQNDDAVINDNEIEQEQYREFQQSNFNEYFDWARTYRYCLYK